MRTKHYVDYRKENEKFLTFLRIVATGCLVAGLYGIIHDQLTYTISPEYYTKFKFYQFGFADEGSEVIFENPRLYVSLVGFLATWWMGIPVATILGLFSLHSDRSKMIDMAMKGFIVTMIIAFVTGLYGLYEGYTYLAHQPKENFGRWFIPDNLVDFKSFIAVGSMHNHSYLGVFFGLFGGIAYVGWQKGIMKMKQRKEVGA
ncbi:hypothetical protein [Chryseolinea sp. H1M3-3]|uniref:hypothetical protein n=1 Tax=Chryseolinea sp. H1M3-3 TaxID=3034144 RepID=UPI0023EDCDBC|nr:hypothetical protein [Chryseolinea sp. H1M3-3]